MEADYGSDWARVYVSTKEAAAQTAIWLVVRLFTTWTAVSLLINFFLSTGGYKNFAIFYQ